MGNVNNAEKHGTKGIEIRPKSLRLLAKINGRLHRKTLKLDPTPANIRHAQKVRQVWIAELKAHGNDASDTFGRVAKEWLDGQDHLAKSTREGYRKILNRYWMPVLWDRQLHTVTSMELKRLVANYQWPTAKTRNNAISPLKMVFEAAYLDEIIDTNPAARIKMIKHQRPEPDPFSMEEVELLLPIFQERDAQYHNYFEFAFFSGLRVSELLALTWDHIDLRAKTATIEAAYVRRETKGTKTQNRRIIELHSRAYAALLRQKEHTYLAGGHVFLDPITGQQYAGDKPPRLVWDWAIKKAGVRPRSPKQTRHTYATICLMSGANPMWVAKQLGHSNMQTTLRVYARWIPGADAGTELAKVEANTRGTAGEPLGVFRGDRGRK